jgi:hypothetical protein
MSDEQEKKAEKKNSSKKKGDKASVLGGKSGRVLLKDKIEIFPNKPLAQYNVGSNKTYSAFDKTGDGRNLIAIVCERNLVPRLKSLRKYTQMANSNLAEFVDSGVVFWPPSGQEHYVFLYEDSWGEPLLKIEGAEQALALGWKSEHVVESIIQPMINVFQDFHDRDFVHSAIRPDNMYGKLGSTLKTLVLGDCLSAPASYNQSALYEPIERAMADPLARGEGTRADDIYAFGVSVAVLLRTHDPLKGLDSRAIIRRKIEFGSYASVAGKDRFKGDVLELLRGTLHDDPAQRWTVEDMLSWLDGRRLSPKQALTRQRAPRPMHFAQQKFFYVEPLAMEFSDSSTETKRIIEDDSLIQWLRRAIDDEAAIERVENAIKGARENGSGSEYQEALVAHVSAALDQYAPLRYKGMNVSGEGLGAALVDAIVLKKDINAFTSLMSSNVMPAWLGFHENNNIDITGLYTTFEQCKRYVRSMKIGEGVERCLYVLASETSCLSPLLENHVVLNPGSLLRAFEGLCQAGKIEGMFVDRHVAAFLMERDSNVIETRIFDLNSNEKHRIALANLRCLADIQKRYEVGPVPAVSKALSKHVGDACEQYHDRSLRQSLKDGVSRLADSGDLQRIVGLLDDPALLGGDKGGYMLAKREYLGLSAEARALAVSLEDRKGFGMEAGRQWAAIISSLLAAIVVVGFTLSMLMGGALF